MVTMIVARVMKVSFGRIASLRVAGPKVTDLR